MLAPNVKDLLQRELHEIFAGIGEGHRKSGFCRTYTKALISLKRSKIGPKLLLMTNGESPRPRHFRLVPKSTTLDNLKGWTQ